MRHSCMVTVLRAFMNSAKSGPSAVISGFPARPSAMRETMSLVEVSPSTLTMLKVSCTSVERAFWSISGETAASVVMNTSMVAMLGWIMPLPLAMPPSRQVLPPRVNSTAACGGVQIHGVHPQVRRRHLEGAAGAGGGLFKNEGHGLPLTGAVGDPGLFLFLQLRRQIQQGPDLAGGEVQQLEKALSLHVCNACHVTPPNTRLSGCRSPPPAARRGCSGRAGAAPCPWP